MGYTLFGKVDTLEELEEKNKNENKICEWKCDIKSGVAWHCNGCETYNTPYIVNLRIIADDFDCLCPHCGKKIRIIS